MTGIELIAAERERQVKATGENWSAEHDDSHRHGEMACAAACYALHGLDYTMGQAEWPWALSWWKPKDRVHDLARAGALIAAEIDRLQRAAESEKAK